MAPDPVIFKTKWLAVRESPRGFQYLERKGKDSIAVFLARRTEDRKPWEVLVRHQHLCVDNREVNGQFNLFPCPVTGAIDDGETPEEAATRETFEETGYQTSMTYLGKYIVGTQTNEICYLYYADVSHLKPSKAPQDAIVPRLPGTMASWANLPYLIMLAVTIALFFVDFSTANGSS